MQWTPEYRVRFTTDIGIFVRRATRKFLLIFHIRPEIVTGTKGLIHRGRMIGCEASATSKNDMF